MKQEIVNLILVFIVALLLTWSLMRESVVDLWQRRQTEQRIIQAVTEIQKQIAEHEKRLKALEGKK